MELELGSIGILTGASRSRTYQGRCKLNINMEKHGESQTVFTPKWTISDKTIEEQDSRIPVNTEMRLLMMRPFDQILVSIKVHIWPGESSVKD